jgi:hypothetical protein
MQHRVGPVEESTDTACGLADALLVLDNRQTDKAIAMLACGYSEAPESSISLEPLGKRLGQLATGLLNPKIAAERLGWVLGIRDRTWVRPIAERISVARSNLSSATLQVPYSSPTTSQTVRRAA